MMDIEDIAPLLHIDDHSIYYFLIVVVFLSVIFVVVTIFLFRFFRKKEVGSAKKRLLKLDFSSPKRDAYEATRLINLLTTPSNKEQARRVLERLKNHKYKKRVEPVGSELKRQIKEFASRVDE